MFWAVFRIPSSIQSVEVETLLSLKSPVIFCLICLTKLNFCVIHIVCPSAWKVVNVLWIRVVRPRLIPLPLTEIV